MKRLIKILFTVLSFNMAIVAVAETNSADFKPSVYGIIIDTSPTDSVIWAKIKGTAREVSNSMTPEDRLGLFSATPDSPMLHVNTIIDNPNSSGIKSMDNVLNSINQAFFLSKADVAKAMELTFKYFDEHSEKYRCCLLVLTDGKHDDNQVKHIRRLASAFKARNWPVMVTTAKNANRQLFLAASQGEFEISLLDQFSVTGWVNKNHVPVLMPAEPSDHSKSIVTPPPLSPIPVYKVKETPKPRVGKPNMPKPTIPNQKAKMEFSRQAIRMVLWILGTIAAAAIIYAVGKKLKSFASEQTSDIQTDNQLYSINAEHDGVNYDLGEEKTINNLIIGTSPASVIPITDEGIEAEHIKLFIKKGHLWIHNISSGQVLINGITLEKGKKEQLLLPSRIQLNENVRIELFRDEITQTNNSNQGI